MKETNDEASGPTNLEVKRLLERTLTRFQNWRVEVEMNPNPRMVHQLKSIVSIIDSLSQITEGRMQHSYKELAGQMAVLVNEVAQLNLRITKALEEDDFLDAEEERLITAGLMSLVRSAVSLIGMVQERFGSGRKLPDPKKLGISADAGIRVV